MFKFVFIVLSCSIFLLQVLSVMRFQFLFLANYTTFFKFRRDYFHQRVKDLDKNCQLYDVFFRGLFFWGHPVYFQTRKLFPLHVIVTPHTSGNVSGNTAFIVKWGDFLRGIGGHLTSKH